MQASIYQLVNTEGTVEEIAYKSGFSTRNYFCKVFKKIHHYTPLEYKKLILSNKS